MQINDEVDLLVEIEDILDELHVLKVVLTDQSMVMHELSETISKASVTTTAKSKDANLSVGDNRVLKAHLTRIEQMEGRAKKTHKTVRAKNFILLENFTDLFSFTISST